MFAELAHSPTHLLTQKTVFRGSQRTNFLLSDNEFVSKAKEEERRRRGGRRDRQAFRNSKSSRIICSPPSPYFAGAIRQRGDTGCCREENSSTPSRVIKALTGNPFWSPSYFEGGGKKTYFSTSSPFPSEFWVSRRRWRMRGIRPDFCRVVEVEEKGGKEKPKESFVLPPPSSPPRFLPLLPLCLIDYRDPLPPPRQKSELFASLSFAFLLCRPSSTRCTSTSRGSTWCVLTTSCSSRTPPSGRTSSESASSLQSQPTRMRG